MKRMAMIAVMMFCASALFAQGTEQVEYIQNLAQKDRATVGDAVHLFALLNGGVYTDFSSAKDFLVSKGIIKDRQYDENAVLKKGLAARMAAKSKNMGDSFFYRLFGSERYAYTACTAEGIMKSGGSEYDPVSGPELIEIIGKLSAPEESNE